MIVRRKNHQKKSIRSQKFCNISKCACLWCIYHMTKTALVVVGVLTCYVLLYSMCDLKAAKINMHHSLIWRLMLYNFKLDYYVAEATKNISRKKCEDAVDHKTVSRCFKKFCSDCKSLNNQTRSGKHKTIDSKAMLQVARVCISHSTVVCHLYDHGKSVQSCQIVPHITKILQKFWLNLEFSNRL